MNKSFLAVFFSVTLLQGILSASLPAAVSTPRPQTHLTKIDFSKKSLSESLPAPVSTPRPQTYQRKVDFSAGRFEGMTEAEAARLLAQDLKEQREIVKSERR